MIDYASVLRGKSVCVVGRAHYLYDKDYGDFIDSHDVVVRVNLPRPQYRDERVIEYRLYQENWDYKQFFVDSKYWGNLGRRTDVFAIANRRCFESTYLWFPGFINNGGIVIRRVKNVVEQKIYRDSIKLLNETGKYSIVDIADHLTRERQYKKMGRKLATCEKEYLPTSGIWVVDDLRSQPLESLSIVGFTVCHNNETGNCYYKQPPDDPYHDIWVDLLLMYYAIGDDFRIQPDAELRETIDRRMVILSKMDRTIKGV